MAFVELELQAATLEASATATIGATTLLRRFVMEIQDPFLRVGLQGRRK